MPPKDTKPQKGSTKLISFRPAAVPAAPPPVTPGFNSLTLQPSVTRFQPQFALKKTPKLPILPAKRANPAPAHPGQGDRQALDNSAAIGSVLSKMRKRDYDDKTRAKAIQWDKNASARKFQQDRQSEIQFYATDSRGEDPNSEMQRIRHSDANAPRASRAPDLVSNPNAYYLNQFIDDSGIDGFTRTAARSLAPTAGSIAGASIGAELGLLGGPLAPLTVPVGAVLGGFAGGYFTNKAQDALLDKTGYLKQVNDNEEKFADKFPTLYFLAGQAPSLLFTHTPSLRTFTTAQGLRKVAGQAVGGATFSAAQQLLTTGTVDPRQMAYDAAANVAFSGESTRLGTAVHEAGAGLARPVTKVAPWTEPTRQWMTTNPGIRLPFGNRENIQAGDLRFDQNNAPVRVEKTGLGNVQVRRQGGGTETVSRRQLVRTTTATPHEGTAFTAIGINNREKLRGALKAVGRSPQEAENLSKLVESQARGWAAASGKAPNEYYQRYLAGLTRGDAALVHDLMTAQTFSSGPAENHQGFTDPVFRHTQQSGDVGLVMGALMAPDHSTLLHETAHVFRRALAEVDPEGFRAVSEWAGVPDGNWTVQHEEQFARAYEHWLQTGQAPNRSLHGVFQNYRQWLSEIYATVRGHVAGHNNATRQLNATPFSPEVIDFLRRYHGDINAPRPNTSGTFRTGTQPLQARPISPDTSPFVTAPNQPLFQSRPTVDEFIKTARAANERVEARLKESPRSAPDFSDWNFASRPAAIDARFPLLDYQTLSFVDPVTGHSYIDPRTNNMVVKANTGYDPEAVGKARIYREQPAVQLGGGHQIGAILKNQKKGIVAASSAPGPITGLINRANAPSITLPTGDRVTAQTPFLTFTGENTQSLGNMDATQLLVRTLRHRVERGDLTLQEANDLILSALYQHLKNKVGDGTTWDNIPYAPYLRAANGEVTLNSWQRHADLLNFTDPRSGPPMGRKGIIQTVLSSKNARAFGLPTAEGFASAMNDERLVQSGPGSGLTLFNVDPTLPLINTYLEGDDFSKSRTYPYVARGSILGRFARPVKATELKLYDAKTGQPWEVRRRPDGSPEGTPKEALPGTPSDPEWRSAPPVVVIPGSLLSELLGLAPTQR